MNKADTINKLQEELLLIKNAYNELHGKEQRKMLALDDVPVFELTIDKEAYITKLSKGFEMVMGYTAEEFTGKNFMDFLADNDEVEGHLKCFERFKQSGYTSKRRWRLLKKSGEIIDVLHSARAVYDDNGNFSGGVGFVLDISDTVHANKALMQSENEKRVILDVMSDGVIYFDTSMRVIWANKVISEVMEIPLGRMKGKRCSDFCPGSPAVCDVCSLPKSVATKRKQTAEVVMVDKTLIIHVNPVFNDKNELNALVMVLSDITERKLLEKQILEMTNNERRSIGHDLHDGLGQMLTAISMMSSSLLEIMDSEREKEYGIVKKIVRYTADTQKLMRNILDGLCPVLGDISDLGDALTCMSARISSVYSINCTFGYDGRVHLPKGNIATHLYLIAQEAVNNAVKHSGCRSVSIIFSKKKGMLIMTISDDGCGFDPSRGTDSGYGMRIIKYRSSIIGATAEFLNTDGKGFSVVVSLHTKIR
ncbi:PAS domain-containing protein [Seleniivibrio sp.]|uniref:PAS domain-containing sensor histidine kinase n=1 Tax=Seleniivibrio sp. TaxID=2898801 RepID=UPI0025EF406D|nr:PAS domain-containing protein [Seleniivibrio sp.]MCD8554159.1 PAS domain S-box protein [Seleniivibrio sp.]